MISVRPATENDADTLLSWANDPATRAAGRHPGRIDAETHRVWLAERLASPACLLLIALDDGRPIGQVRLESEREQGRVEVGIAVTPEARGRGYSREVLAAALAAGVADPELQTDVFVARIRPENAASTALFRGAGFQPTGEDSEAGVRYLVYERSAG